METRGTLKLDPPNTVICRYCLKPMQKAEDVFNTEGEVISRRFLCACKGTIFHWNWHSGQSTETRGKP